MKGGIGEPKSDDIPDLELALRETIHPRSGICLCRDRHLISNSKADSLLTDCRELQMIIASSIRSVRHAR